MVEIFDITSQLPRARGYTPAPLTRINAIAVHSTDADSSTPLSTARYHIDHNGWRSIGYHLYMLKEGKVFQTLPFDCVGINAPPNFHRIGVVLVGKCSGLITPQQKEVLPQLLIQLCVKFNVATNQVFGHLELMPGHTDCPGDSVLSVVAAFRAAPPALLPPKETPSCEPL